MTSRLANKKAVVTGGSRGIGAAIARKLAEEGADVVITYMGNHAAAKKTVAGITALGVRGQAIVADASNREAVQRAIDEAAGFLGGIDILVHNAGTTEMPSVAEVDGSEYLESFSKQFAINVDGVVSGTVAAIPHLQKNGRILIIGSVNAHQMPFAGGAIYGASKAAVVGLARGWARELGGKGILVNVLQPGPIHTDLNPADEREVAKTMAAMTAIKRYGRTEEVAAVAAFLVSDEASYITGATLDVDGGFSI